ncbi:MAG: helix-turn-helix domain-containing protein [Arenicellales bacterium]|nr:helix-turn-helix domain-containing protein [Arenicellales bacterium]
MTNIQPIRVGILVVPGFTALHLDLLVDGFRIANRVEKRERFDWTIVAEYSDGVEASNGRVYRPDSLVNPPMAFDIAFVVAGYCPESSVNDLVIAWLRTQQQHAAVIGAVDTGTVLLAHAGLGRGRELAIHWEHEAVLATSYPELTLSSTGAVVDGRYFTSSGGLSAATTVLSVIRRFCSAFVAGEVAHILYQSGRPAQMDRLTPRANPVERVEILMRQNLQAPLSLDEIAGAVHMHKRTLARVFARERGVTPMARYRELRLVRAKELLNNSRLMLSEVAHLTGFSSGSAFSTAFKNRFGYPPSQAN